MVWIRFGPRRLEPLGILIVLGLLGNIDADAQVIDVGVVASWVDSWQAAPSGSAAEREYADSIVRFVDATFGGDFLVAIDEWLDAPADSPEETAAATRIAAIVSGSGISVEEAIEIGRIYASASRSAESRIVERLVERWRAAAVGTETERVYGDSIVRFVDLRLGSDFVDAIEQWLNAPDGSSEKSVAEARIEDNVAPLGISVEAAIWMGQIYDRIRAPETFPLLPDSAFSLEVGDTVPHEVGDIEVMILRSSEVDYVDAGETAAIYGQIHNHSDRPIWIVDRFTTAITPPSVLGNARVLYSIFPTTRGRLTDEVVRIDPRASYNVMWVMDPEQSKKLFEQDTSARINPVSDFFTFKPGSYKIAITMHVWARRPVSEDGFVVNVGDSYVVATTADVNFGVSISVLLIGATIGSIMGFVLIWLVDFRKRTQSAASPPATSGGSIAALFNRSARFAAGLVVSALLAVIGTVLLSRLAGTDFLITVSINDAWGSIATGFVIQIGGLRYLIKLAGGSGSMV